MHWRYFYLFALNVFLSTVTAQTTSSNEPWLTGPLLALTAQVLPVGHTEFELYGMGMESNAIYNGNYMVQKTAPYRTVQVMPTFRYGFAKNFDIEWDILYQFNSTQGNSASNIGDTVLIMGYQLLKQDGHKRPDINLVLAEILPSGRYDELALGQNGVSATGEGSFQTGLGINLQYLTLVAEHYLNLYINIGFQYASTVQVNGVSAYGGTPDTQGNFKPGNQTTLDLATEITLTQNWVAVLEGSYEYETKSHFRGNLGNFSTLQNATAPFSTPHQVFPSKRNLALSGIGYENRNMFTLAPAIEYNFSATYGIIAGVWFSVFGKNSPRFMTPSIAFNANW